MASTDMSSDPCKEVINHGMANSPGGRKVQCDYCTKVVPGFNRLQHHLGGIRGNIMECRKVPGNVKEYFRNGLVAAKVDRLVNEVGDLGQPGPSAKRRLTSNGPTDSSDPKALSSTLERKRCVGRFFFENAIDFSAVKSPSFENMLGIFSSDGEPLPSIPSVAELSGWILSDELNEIENYVKEVKQSWAKTGCSVLLDGWTDQLGRSLVNVVVDCPAGPIYLCSADVSPSRGPNTLLLFLESVMQEVGIENVVQIVAHAWSESYEAIGTQLLQKHRSLFWTYSGTHCLSLILEKIAGCSQIKATLEKAKFITQFIYGRATVLDLLRKHTQSRDLFKPSKIKSATPFLTLENFLEERDNLEFMFTSSEWLASHWSLSHEGKMVTQLIGDTSFWDGVDTAVKAAVPIVKALSLINKDDGAHLGFIYETMDQIKETISEEFGEKKSRYNQYWAVIDEVWNPILHSPLHAAGYFLNPRLFYTEDFFADTEVAGGLLLSIVKMLGDQQAQDMASQQINMYGSKHGGFQLGFDSKDSLPPAAWWDRYGAHCPQLQKVAVRILSQTCNGAEIYELRRDLAENLLSNTGRNATEQQKLHTLTYLNYNLKLKQSKLVVPKYDIVADQIDPLDDWVSGGVSGGSGSYHAEANGSSGNGPHVGTPNHGKLERGGPSSPKTDPKPKPKQPKREM